VGTRCLRPGLLALGQNQRCRRALERAGPDAPARVVVAHRQHRSGDRQVQPYRPRIARSGSGDGSGATVGIIRMAALTLDFCYLTGQAQLADANHCLPFRPPEHPSAGPLEGQHPPGQCNGQRRETVTGGQPWQPPARQGVEAAGAPRIGGIVSTPEPALGSCVSRIAGTARQRDEQHATCGPTPPTARLRSWSYVLGVLRAGRAGCRYRLRSPLPGDLLCTWRPLLSHG